MLIETKAKISYKDKEDPDKEISEYMTILVNTDQVMLALPVPEIPGHLMVFMANGGKQLIKDDMKKFIKK